MTKVQKHGLEVAYAALNEGNITDAAKKYSAWWRGNKDSLIEAEFREWLPGMFKAFWNCDECKEHINEIVCYNSGKGFEGSNAIFDIAATVLDDNLGVFSNVLETLNETNNGNRVLEQNKYGRTPIELAFLHDNKKFIEIVRKCCDLPKESDIMRMNYIEDYARMKESVDPEIIHLLIGNKKLN